MQEPVMVQWNSQALLYSGDKIMKRNILYISLILLQIGILTGCQNGSRLSAKQAKEMAGPAPPMPAAAIAKFQKEHASVSKIPPAKLKPE